jgi:5-methylcytosine-specific restriction endonuclease McrA
MGRRLPTTPRSKVRAAIRQLWLRSRERAAALKRDRYTCVLCGKKQSKAKGKEQKVEVHHKEGHIPNWELIIDEIFKSILCNPEFLETNCPECHDKQSKEDYNDLPF